MKKIEKPDPKLIDSMAMRYRHDFGLLSEDEKNNIRVTMEQLWEEVVGLGFYKKEDDIKSARAKIEAYYSATDEYDSAQHI